MRRSIGLLAERYSKWERRAALTPSHVEQLVRRGVDVLVQPSSRRVFSDSEYVRAGASITADLSGANAIFGVKQAANGSLLPDKTYLFFSHVIKAQQENMALLDEVLEKNVRLIDYECVREGGGGSMPRLIAFGDFAGKAGVIDAFRGLGLRMLSLGYSTPFLAVGPAHSYQDYADATRAIKAAGDQIREHGLPAAVSPFVVTVCGTGNVSRGARETLNALGPETVEWVTPEELPQLSKLLGTEGEHTRKVYACLVSAEHVVERCPPDGAVGPGRFSALSPAGEAAPFDRGHYYAHPHEYRPVFHDTIAPHTSMLVTTMYWDRRYPRLLTNDQLGNLRQGGNERMLAVADLTCDVEGAVEALVRTSSVDDPFYVYDVSARQESPSGLDGDGLMLLGVDILPSELPREASAHFGDALLPFVETLATGDATLPPELAAATIAQKGELTPTFAYISAMRDAFGRETSQEGDTSHLSPSQMLAVSGSTVLSMHGHLFDSGLINAALDVVEQAGGRFDLLEINVRPNALVASDTLSLRTKSSALLQLTLDDGREALESVLDQLHTLATFTLPLAEGSIHELPDYCNGVYHRTVDPIPNHSPTSDKPAAKVGKPSTPPPTTKAAAGGRNLVVLGAGLCAGPAVEMLSRTPTDTVHVVSALSGEAAKLAASLSRPNVVPHTFDVSPGSSSWPRLVELLTDASAALSLLPAFMHAPVGKECVKLRVPLVTASYVSPDVAALHDDALAANVPILCELGLDPGLDHMSAAALIARVRADGGEVTSFRSVCGGLPAPECAFDGGNPLGYKFSWSPAGVISATRNSAQWKEDGATQVVDASELLKSARPLSDGNLGKAFSLECLPNRDALPYMQLYGLPDAHTFFRGTLRYRGWCDLMDGFVAFGLTKPETPLPTGVSTWPQLLSALNIPHEPTSLSDDGHVRAAAALHWLGAWDDSSTLVGATVSDAFCALLGARLTYGERERDAVLMEHTVGVSYGGTRRDETISSSLVGFGDDAGGDSAMSRSVGLTAASGVHRLLAPPSETTPALAGVLRPTEPSVWSYCLPVLEEEGMRFQEGVDVN